MTDHHEIWCAGAHVFTETVTCEYVLRMRWVTSHSVHYCPKSASGYHTFSDTSDVNSPCGHRCGAVYGDLTHWSVKIPVSLQAPFYPVDN